MCLAIAPASQRNSSLLARAWYRLSLSPLKLFLIGAGLHVVLSTTIIIFSFTHDGYYTDVSTLLFVLTYGILALIVFGYLMHAAPKKYALSPIHRGRYNSIFLFMTISLFMLEAGSLTSNALVTIGMIFMFPGWAIALQGLKNMLVWIPDASQVPCKVITTLLFALFIGLIASILAQISGNYHYFYLALSFVNLVFWLIAVFSSGILLSKAPPNARVISI